MKITNFNFLLSITLLIEFILTAKTNILKVFEEDDPLKMKFINFKSKFSKKYSKEEEAKRFQIYKANYLKAKALNKKAKKSGKANNQEVFGETFLFDLSDEEYHSKYLSLKIDNDCDKKNTNIEEFEKRYQTNKIKVQENTLIQTEMKTDKFDWRDYYIVGPVRNQDQCGSCWAFAGIGVLESQYNIYHQQWIEFSKQQLVDCDTSNQGCKGGTIQKGLDYIIQKGLMTEKSYPYLGYDNQCYYNYNKAFNMISFYDTFIVETKFDFLKYVIQNYGPVAAAMNAEVLKYYKEGIINVETLDCDPKILNHGVLIIGFGKDNSGVDYLIVKNYWGNVWGEKGFFRIAAKDLNYNNNPYGVCGINSFIVTVKLS